MKKLLFIFLTLSISPLQAKEALEDLFALSLNELMQIQVTGSTLTSENYKTVPSAVTIFTHEEIRRMGLDTLDELMNLVPGYQSYRTSFSSLAVTFSSRGRRIGPSSSEVLVMIDGQRIETSQLSGSSQILPKYPLMLIERVEFIRGPGATIYGSNAMLGIINIITRSGVNEASLSVGSFNRRKASWQNTYKIGDAEIDFVGHIDTDKGEDYQVKDTFSSHRIDTDDPRQLADFGIKLKWKKTQLNLQHNQFKSENLFEFERVSNGVNERRGRVSSISLKYDLNWQSVSSWFWLSYNLASIKATGQLTAPGALAAISDPASNDPLFMSVNFENFTESRAQWHNDWNINEHSSLQFGLELRHIKAPEATSNNNFDLSDFTNGNLPIRFYGNTPVSTMIQAASSRDIFGFYTQYQQQLFDSTHLTLGLRYDNFSSISSQLSPRIGLVQALNEHHNLKLLYGEAFRAPNETELNVRNNPVLQGNPNLKPETVKTWDLIWIGQWSLTRFSLGYFENNFKDSIVEALTNDGTRQYQNVNQDTVKGLEFEISQELNEHWLLRANYTKFNQKPDLSFRETEQLASLVVNYQRSSWNANLIVTWTNEREIPIGSSGNRLTLDEYWQIFGKLIYNINSNWRGYVQVKNLLDENYLTPTTTGAISEGVPNRGREILSGIVWRF